MIRAIFWLNCSREARCLDCVCAVPTVGFEGGDEACSWLDEALRPSFEANLREEDVFDLIDEIRCVSEEVRERFCWMVARTMHRRHMGSLNGVRVGRSHAIVMIYVRSTNTLHL